MLREIGNGHLTHGQEIRRRLPDLPNLEVIALKNVPDSEARVSGEVIGQFVLVPRKRNRQQDLAARLQHPLNLPQYLVDREDMLKDLKRNDRVKAVVRKGERLAIVISVHPAALVIVPGRLDIHAKIAAGMGE